MRLAAAGLIGDDLGRAVPADNLKDPKRAA